jgi:hypothetical protein
MHDTGNSRFFPLGSEAVKKWEQPLSKVCKTTGAIVPISS